MDAITVSVAQPQGSLLPFHEINVGLLTISGEILPALHYAMWLEIKYDHQLPDVQIDIAERPGIAFESDVTKYLSEHPDFWVLKKWECPRCGELPWQEEWKKCPRLGCGEALKPITDVPPERFRREKARLEVLDSASPVAREYLICRRIVLHLTGNDWTTPGTTLFLSLKDMRARMGEMFEECVDRLHNEISIRDPMRLEGRRDLYPRGDTLAAKHVDYLGTRDKLISCYQWLYGRTSDHPEFIEIGENSRGIAVFNSPVPLPVKAKAVPDVPVWDAERRELSFRGKICKSFPKSVAPNQTSILEAFQRAGWPTRIEGVDDPDGEPLVNRRLLETIRGLKRRLRLITFRANGTGRGVIWDARKSKRD